MLQFRVPNRLNPAAVEVEPLTLDTIASLSRALEVRAPPIHLAGVHSCASLGLLLSQTHSGRPAKRPLVIVTPDHETAERLMQSIEFFDPFRPIHLLPAFDVDPYSGLYPNPRVIASRLRWLYQATRAYEGEIFVASVEALMQKTLPFQVFNSSTRVIERGSELPKDFASYLAALGYTSVPTVEDVGSFTLRGGVIDIFSPAHSYPVRLELFGDTVETLRFFDPSTQLSLENSAFIEKAAAAVLLPAREVLYSDDNRQRLARALSQDSAVHASSQEARREVLRAITQGQPFYGIDYLIPFFYENPDSPLQFFSCPVDYWIFHELEATRKADEVFARLKKGFTESHSSHFQIPVEKLYVEFEKLELPPESTSIYINTTVLGQNHEDAPLEMTTFSLQDFAANAQPLVTKIDQLSQYLGGKFQEWQDLHYRVFVACNTQSSLERLKALFEKANIPTLAVNSDVYTWSQTLEQMARAPVVALVARRLPESFRIPSEHFVFLRDEDIWGKRGLRRQNIQPDMEAPLARSQALSFGDLNPGDLVVHRVHGVARYEGLKVMRIEGAEAEFIELGYRDGDRLYLPIYRIGQLHKFVGPSGDHMIDKLGTNSWSKAKTKVRSHLRDIASKLLALYAKRAEIYRAPLSPPDNNFVEFENLFPYDETPDQLHAISDILNDFRKERPMDRLICGDVGFGKTEVAMRAAFKVVEDHKQVAIIAPTTILTFQHYENFKKRFSGWAVEIRELNRFVSSRDVKKTLADLRDGKVDIVIGTHRLLSRDVEFKNLGLLIIDEEQKFGVTHKERLRHLRENVDTLAMSATPIPRTLNMSLVGIRDMSLINTPPEDRLPTRTFVVKSDDATIAKAIESEIARGGQVFFLHNRVQTIDEVAARIRKIVPAARIAIAHGQMEEDALEKAMLKVFHHEVDVLICTSIIESGMDIPRANTILIDNAHTFGLSQLYQLRGRVGRSHDRAYCYLLLPQDRRIDAEAAERLKVIQENTALGSGIRVAQYDLELRGAGDILGESQSGHINAVGYELYLELLEEAVSAQKGDSSTDAELEPEMNLRISALFPDTYIPDIRMRLYYYKVLSQIRSEEDIDRIEEELRDQFGPPPEQVLNLLGLMYIRRLCRDLGVRDISASKLSLTLSFTEKTTLPTDEIIRLTTRENKKYQLAPDQRLKIRMNEITWPRVVDELLSLLALCPNKSGAASRRLQLNTQPHGKA